MNKVDILYNQAGTSKILARFNVQQEFYKNIENSVNKILSIKIKDKSSVVYSYFLRGISNMMMYRLAHMLRRNMGTEEERLVLLFASVLATKSLDDMEDMDIKELSTDFAKHIFWDFTFDKKHKNWTPHTSNIPNGLTKLVNNSCFDLLF